MGYQFGKRSKEQLETCHADLQKVMNRVIEKTRVDFSIVQGHRSIKTQQEYYAQGRTKPGKIITYVDGVNKKSKHNYTPSLAVDIVPYYGGKQHWDHKHLCYLAGVVITVADDMHKAGEISHRVRWGGNWDMDGTILYDQKFADAPHFELIK